MNLSRQAVSFVSAVHRRVGKLIRLLGYWQTLYFAVHWVLGTRMISLRLAGVPTALWCRPQDSDIAVLYSAFILRDCDEAVPVTPKTILDLGANIGSVSVFLANKYRDAKIVAVELDPANAGLLRKNTEAYPLIEVVEGAVWSSRQPCLIDRGDGRSYQLKAREVPEGTPGAAVSLTMDDLLERLPGQRVDLLKMDIEGAELALFSAHGEEWIERIGMLIVETHGAEAREAVVATMQRHGFRYHINDEKLVFVKS